MSKYRVPLTVKKKVIAKAKGCCEYCLSQEVFSPQPFSIEHIVPVNGGGGNEEENLAFACQGCNNYKYTKTSTLDPVSGEMVPLYHPRMDEWDQHFV